MRRHIWGVMAATVAAPYLAGFIIGFYIELDDVVSHGERFKFLDLLKFLPISTIALVIFGIPLLIFASICAALLNMFECRTKWGPILAGVVLGFCFVAVLHSSPSHFSEEWLLVLATSALPGAICGWIYWRIAIGRTPDNSRAIDAA